MILFMPVVLCILLAFLTAANLVPLSVAGFFCALLGQASLWVIVRRAVRRARMTPSGELGPMLRSLETLRRYVADEDLLPSRGS